MTGERLQLVSTNSTGAPAGRSDDELMTLVRTGHAAAFEELVRRHTARVTGLAAKYVGDRERATDVLQETFMRLWVGRDKYEPGRDFRAYLFQICVNCCREVARARKRVRRANEALIRVGVAPQPEVDAELLKRETELSVERAMSRLPKRYKEALLLRFHAELTYSEMRTVLGASEATLRSRVFHGLRGLRRHLRGRAR